MPKIYAAALAISGIHYAGWIPSGQWQTSTNFYGGLWNPSGWARQAGMRSNYSNHYWEWSPSRGNAPPIRENAAVGIGMNVYYGGVQGGASGGASAMSVVLKDQYPPADIHFNGLFETRDRTTGVASGLKGTTVSSPLRETAWFDPTKSDIWMKSRAWDQGLGVKYLEIVRQGRDTAGSALPWGQADVVLTGGDIYSPADCDGKEVYDDKCVATYESPAAGAAVPTDAANQIPEGITELRLKARDLSGNVGWGHHLNPDPSLPPRTDGWVNLKVDKTDPVINVPAVSTIDGQTLYGSSYRITIDATDGSTSTPKDQRSGVVGMTVTVDGVAQTLYGADGGGKTIPVWSCTNSCGRNVWFDLKTWEGSLGGEHTIRITAWDAVGRTAEKILKPTYYPTSIRHGGANGAVDTPAEVTAVRNEIQSQSVDVGDATWWALMQTDRVYVASVDDPADPQQMCREAFADSIEGTRSFRARARPRPLLRP